MMYGHNSEIRSVLGDNIGGSNNTYIRGTGEGSMADPKLPGCCSYYRFHVIDAICHHSLHRRSRQGERATPRGAPPTSTLDRCPVSCVGWWVSLSDFVSLLTQVPQRTHRMQSSAGWEGVRTLSLTRASPAPSHGRWGDAWCCNACNRVRRTTGARHIRQLSCP